LNKKADPNCCNKELFTCVSVSQKGQNANLCSVKKAPEGYRFCSSEEYKNELGINFLCPENTQCGIQTVLLVFPMPACVMDKCATGYTKAKEADNKKLICCEDGVETGVNVGYGIFKCTPKKEDCAAQSKRYCKGRDKAAEVGACCGEEEICFRYPNGVPICVKEGGSPDSLAIFAQEESALLAFNPENPGTPFGIFQNRLFAWNIFSERKIEPTPEVNSRDLLENVLISLNDWIKSEIA
jgi:hypothetical protein